MPFFRHTEGTAVSGRAGIALPDELAGQVKKALEEQFGDKGPSGVEAGVYLF